MDGCTGASISRRPGGADMQAEMEAVAEEMRAAGRRPYVIPGGGSTPVGALGYVDAAQELVTQASDMGLRIDHVVHATGSAGTQAGLVAGLVALNSGIPVLGIGVRAPRPSRRPRLPAWPSDTRSISACRAVKAEHVVANCDMSAGLRHPDRGHGGSGEAGRRAGGHPARPGLFRQRMAGLIDLIAQKKFGKDENVVFIHTGGQVGLFGYPDASAWPATPRGRRGSDRRKAARLEA